MIASLRAEYRKLVSTRVWWALLLVMAAYVAFAGGSIAASFVFAADVDGADQGNARDLAVLSYSLGNAVAYVFPLVIGSLAITTEFRHRTVTATLLASPNRTRVLIAKLVASIPIGLLYGLVGTAALVLSTAPLLAWFGDGAYLGDRDVQQVIVFSVLALAAWTVVGVAFGCVVSNQIVAIVALIVFTQFIEPTVRIITLVVEPLQGLSRFFPGAAADAVVGASFFGSLGPDEADLLTRWQGALVLIAYALVFFVIGRFTTFRRDIG